MTIQQAQEKIDQKYINENLKIIKYTKMKDEGSIQCLKCGSIYTLKHFENFLIKTKNKVCSKCFPNKKEQRENTLKKFNDWLQTSNFSIVSDLNFCLASDIIETKCKFCGRLNRKTIRDYLKGKTCGCKFTSNSGRIKTYNEIKNNIPYGYKFLKEYQGANKKTLIQHDCGFIYEGTPHNLFQGKGCPKCNRKQSKGERKIEEFLIKYNIIYEKEVVKNINNHNLRFDFFLKDFKIFIEFQGIQHFVSVDFFGGEEQLKKQKNYDNLKRQWCKKNNFVLIEIDDLDKIDVVLSEALTSTTLRCTLDKQDEDIV